MASSNPYQVLGVPQDAHDDAIKAAYRKQSLLYHPDKHPDDTTAATERMKKINEAYESLKPENRTATDEVLGKTSSPRAQAPGHQRQWSGSPFAQRAGSHRAGDDFWWQNRYYGQQRRQHQQEQAKRERERSARAWREAEEQAERDRRAQQARERKRQREQEKIKRYWEERRERREREAREREEAERVRREEAERRRREEEEEAARKHQEKADRIREVREQSQRAFRAMEERDYQKKRAAEEEVRKRLIERELARQRWEREQRQSAQFVELYQRHDTVYNEWLQLEAEYNNLLPLVRLDLSGPDPLARYISRSVLDTEDAVGSQAHPYRTEWITWMDHFRGAWPNIYLFGKSGIDTGPLLDSARIKIEQLEDYTRKLLIIFQTRKQEDSTHDSNTNIQRNRKNAVITSTMKQRTSPSPKLCTETSGGAWRYSTCHHGTVELLGRLQGSGLLNSRLGNAKHGGQGAPAVLC